jgi:hypothetical protein
MWKLEVVIGRHQDADVKEEERLEENYKLRRRERRSGRREWRTTTCDKREEACYGWERRDRQEEKRTRKGEGWEGTTQYHRMVLNNN